MRYNKYTIKRRFSILKAKRLIAACLALTMLSGSIMHAAAAEDTITAAYQKSSAAAESVSRSVQHVIPVTAAAGFTEPENADAVNNAQISLYALAAVNSNTYNNETACPYFGALDVLQEMTASDGKLYAAYGKEDTVYIVPQDTEQDAIKIEKKGFTFGASVLDENDNLYILWGRSASDEELASDMEIKNIILAKYDLQGNAIDACGLSISLTNAKKPFDFGNANLCCSNGVIGCFYDTEWTSGHQGSEFAAVNAKTMELIGFSNWQGSHSLGLALIPTPYGFAGIQRGDATARGINFTSYCTDGNEVTFDYLGGNGRTRIFSTSGTYGESGSHLNDTHLYMGGIAQNGSTYALAGKAERFVTSGNYAEYVESHPGCGAGVYDVFVRVLDQSLGDEGDFAGVDRIDAETGEIADRNVIWLTECNENEKAGNVKIAAMEDGSYCVLWEKIVDGKFDSVRYVILDACGNLLRSEREIRNARISGTTIQPVVQGTTLTWATADTQAGGIVWYKTDLEAFKDTSGSYKAAEALAKEYDLPYRLKEGCYGMCGEDVCWVYLNDVQMLLVAGTGEMSYIGNAPWAAFAGGIETAIVGEGVTTLYSNAFKGCQSMSGLLLPETLTQIGNSAFYACTSLQKLRIPESVTKIGSGAFSYCTELEQITLSSSLKEIKQDTFEMCNALKTLTIPDSVTTIGTNAFRNCSDLTSVIIPANVEVVEELAFNVCGSLNMVLLLNPETEIGTMAFGYRYYSSTNQGKHGNPNICGYAGSTAQAYAEENGLPFIRCDGVCGETALWQFDAQTGTLYIFGSGEMADLAKGKQPWAEYLPDIKDLVIDDGITSIGANAFAGADNLASFFPRESITAIGSNAFEPSCTLFGLPGSAAERYAQENEVKYFALNGKCGEQALWYYDEEDKALYIFGTGEMYDNMSWGDCQKEVQTVFVGNGITSLGSYAFSYFSALETADLPDSLERIGEHAFDGCKMLKSLTIPAKVTTIEKAAFQFCESLESVTVLNPMAEIAYYAIGFNRSSKPVDYDVTIYGYDGSTAEKYADWHGVPFVSLGVVPISVQVTIRCGGETVRGANLQITEVHDTETHTVASWNTAFYEMATVENLTPEQVYVLESTDTVAGYLPVKPVYFYFDTLGICHTSADGKNWRETENTILIMQAAKTRTNLSILNDNAEASEVLISVNYLDEDGVQQEAASLTASGSKNITLEGLTADMPYEVICIPLHTDGSDPEKYASHVLFCISSEDGKTYLLTDDGVVSSVPVEDDTIEVRIPEIITETTTEATTTATTTEATTTTTSTTTTTTSTTTETTTTNTDAATTAPPASMTTEDAATVASQETTTAAPATTAEVPFSTAETTTAALETTIPDTEDVTPGDVNGDGAIDASDVAMLLAESANIGAGLDGTFTDEQFSAADVNCDGEIDASDAAAILAYAAAIGAGDSNASIQDFV